MDLHRLPHPVAHQGLPHRGLVGEAVAGAGALHAADDAVLQLLVELQVQQLYRRADVDDVLVQGVLVHHPDHLQLLLQGEDAGLHDGLLVFGLVVLAVLGKVAKPSGGLDLIGKLGPLHRFQLLQLIFQFFVAFGCQNDLLCHDVDAPFLQNAQNADK